MAYLKSFNRKTKMKPESGHYYTRDGAAAHFVPKKDGSGNRPTTVADARKLGLLPSPTTILKVLAKPALTEWLIRTAIMAFATAPDVAGETLDQKITRVLDTERQQDQESDIAKEFGGRVHEAIECKLNDVEPPEWTEQIAASVFPVLDVVHKLGRVVATEKILVGADVAGRTDCITESDEWFDVVDFKTTKKLPERGAWPEHLMQAACYAHCLGNTGSKRIACTIIYISTTEPGKIAVFRSEVWEPEWQKFRLLLEYWKLTNGIV